jgi:nicotinamide-nucleotide amidase
MQPVINQAHNYLIKYKKTIAVAESCTGGLISYLLTQLPGSSQYFHMGVVAYSNKAKIDILKIPAKLILKKGAVSKEIASKLASSVRKLANTDLGIGITGIAGPTAGTPKKPVGTVFIAIDNKKREICKKFLFHGSRITIRKKSALKTLELLKLLVTSY